MKKNTFALISLLPHLGSAVSMNEKSKPERNQIMDALHGLLKNVTFKGNKHSLDEYVLGIH